MLLLAFDTATPAVTVALHDGAQIVAEESTVDARRHGELLAAAIDRALRGAGAGAGDLTAIAVGTGPGPYTGLRAGLVTARVFGSALRIPVDGICTLDVIAAAAVPQAGGREFLVATDARRKELYWARYSAFGERVTGPEVSSMSELPAGLPVAGEGALLNPELAAEPIGPRYPTASRLAVLAVERIASRTAPAPAQPLYLRRPERQGAGPAQAGNPVTPAPLRVMTPADLDAVLGLELELFGEEAWSRPMLEAELSQQPASRHYLVAQEAGTVVGYAGLLAAGTQADVVTIAVTGSRQGQGTGSALLEALLAEARRRRCTEVFLEVRVDNLRAQQLYRSRDFEQIGIRRGYYQPSGADALVMRLNLAGAGGGSAGGPAGGGAGGPAGGSA